MSIYFYMKRLLFISLLFIYGSSFTYSQQITITSSEILQALKKLNTIGSVLYIAAHPDDENTRLLAYLSKEKNLRTGYLSLTRGDGGQNLIGKEQGDLLGLIRTQELLAARKIDGAEQFFTRANDFGFSKNPEETLKIWNKDSVLADVVWCIRRFKPDVIICRFPTTGEGGHGHHTSSAILALEAFDAAADPKKFPEQLTYTEPWKATRIYWNTFNFGTNNTTSPEQLKADVGLFNPLIGKSYGEIAAESRSMHKSQGMGSAKTRGTTLEYFKYLKGATINKDDLFEGIDQTWKRVPNTAKIKELINATLKAYNTEHPENSVSQLADIYKELQLLNDTDTYVRYWKNQKLKEVESLLLACSALWLEATATDYTGIPGNNIAVTIQFVNRSNSEIKLNKITWPASGDTITGLALKTNQLYSFKHTEKLPASLPYSTPYWLKQQHDIGMYHIAEQPLIGKPENESTTTVVFDIEFSGIAVQFKRPIVYKFTDPVKGEVYRPFEVVPPVTVNIPEKVYVFTENNSKAIQFVIKSNTPNVSGKLAIEVPTGWKINIEKPDFTLNNKGDELIINTTVTPGTGSGKLKASVITDNGNTYSKSISRIEYDHIPYQFTLTDAEVQLVSINVTKAGTTIGYIPGSGDEIPACLQQLGYTVTTLTDDLLTNSDLSKYNAIVAGVRAHNTNERLQAAHNKLMEYVKNGGNLIVQYNTNNRIGPLVAKIGPYPFNISRERVTDETAEVRIVRPRHAILNFPNKITEADFKDWKQERGIYFATELDANYETILSMNDPNEKPNEGSLIVAKYGKGNFVYTGLVFFRELPAGVSGAYRLFVNLLSIPKNEE